MRSLPPMMLAGFELKQPRHICAFFADDEEEYRVLLPFIRDGLANGERAVHILNPEERQQHIKRLAGAGIDTVPYEASGQLKISDNSAVYLREGNFDPDQMLIVFEELASGGKSAGGFPLSRILCRMDCVSQDYSNMDKVIEFEARVNDLWSQHQDAVICTYRLSLLSGDAVIDILRTHPLVIIGSLLHQNPFFVPPEQFLRQHRKGRSSDPESA